jgi:hypothetical protein
MVLSAVASALSFFNATRFSERSTDLADEARFNAALESQRQSRAGTMVAHDQRVALECVSAEGTRDAALQAYSQRFDKVDLARAVAEEQRRIALASLFLYAPGVCSQYDAKGAFEYFASPGPATISQPDWRLLLAESNQTRVAEQFAVGATVLFAIVLLLATLADLSTSRRWLRTWLLFGILVAVAASTAAYAAGSTRHGAGSVTPIVVTIVVVLAVFFVITRRRRGRDDRPAGPTESRRHRVTRHVVAAIPRRATWWAEVLGATTLVVFALSALALSASAARERQALTDGDRYTLEAREALDVGQEATLAVLDYAEEYSWAEAEMAAASATTGGRDVAAGTNATTAVLDRWAAVKADWDRRLDARTQSGADGQWDTCLDRDMILPWHRLEDATGDPLPVSIREAQRTDLSAPFDLVASSGEGAARCEVHAAMSRAAAAGWSERSSRYTLALLVLGLAGFLFAFAADPDRSEWPRRWLLSSAMIGILVGAGLSASAWAAGEGKESFADIDRGAAAFARAQNATATWHCDIARSEAATAGAALAGLAISDVVQAGAAACREATEWLVSPWLGQRQLDDYRAALLRAYQRDPDSPSIVHSFGWSQILGALLDRDAAVSQTALEAGLSLVQRATIADAKTIAPWGCFNAALATYTLGNVDSAKDLYADAVASVRGEDRPGMSCPTTETAQAVMPPFMTLAALGDLELLPDDPIVTEIREMLVNGSTPTTGQAPDVTGLRLTVTPTQIGFEGDAGPLAAADISVVWYYRETSEEPWSILITPSLTSLVPGRHIHFWPTAQLMPDGEYRADVYLAGRRASITSADTWWSQKGIDSRDWKAVFLGDVGLTTVIPRKWDLVSRIAGVEVTFGDGHGSVSVRRAEGSDEAGLKARLEAWSGETWSEVDQSETTAAFGGLPSIAVWARDNVLLGAGYQRYLAATAPDLAAQVTGDSCPGTTLMMAIRANEALAQTIWVAQNLTAFPPTIDPTTIRVSSPFRSDLFSVEFPEGWTASACPGEFIATSTDMRSSVSVQIAPWTGSLGELRNARLKTTSDASATFTVVADEPTRLANDVPARRIVYTRNAEGGRIRQTVVVATLDGRAMTLLLTEPLDGAISEPDRALILNNLTFLED